MTSLNFYGLNAAYWFILSAYLAAKEYPVLGVKLSVLQFLTFLVFGFLFTSLYRHRFGLRIRQTNDVNMLFVKALPWLVIMSMMVVAYDFFIDQMHYGIGFGQQPSYFWTLCSYFVDGFIITLPWFLFYHCYQYGKNVSLLEKTRALQQADLSKAKVENLTQKLNPHFLFNTLNTIRWLALHNPTLARAAIDDLAQILRYSTGSSNAQTTSLSSELGIVKQYLSLEKLRFEDLEFLVNVDESLGDVEIPVFSIINLVENAVTHGLSQVEGKKYLTIEALKKGGSVVIEVSNSGSLSKINKGFGLQSIESLLKHFFGNEASVSLEIHSDQVLSTITFPYRAD